MIELTVCIPVYNGAEVIERAVRSVLDNTSNRSCEVLICDDGSTDHTPEILDELQNEYSAVRVIRNSSNRGRPHTRNRLMEEASGRFLTWLDADDEKFPTMVTTQLEYLDRTEAEHGANALEGLLVYTNYEWQWSGSDTGRIVAPEQPEDPMAALLSADFGGYLWLMMGLRSTFLAVGAFDESLPRLQDLDFFIRFAEIGGRFERVDTDDPLCRYNKDDRGRDATTVWVSWTRIWRKHHHHFVAYGMENARRWRRHHYRVSRRFARNNGDDVAFAKILFLEVIFVIRGRFRRLIFDA